MKLFSYIFPQIIETLHSGYNKTIQVVERFGKRELYVNGIQQSGPYTIRLWKEGLSQGNTLQSCRALPYVKQILVFGVGGGTLFPILHTLFPTAHITGVDVDSEIIRLYEKYFKKEKGVPIRLCCQDARKFVSAQLHKNSLYDLIIVDIYTGNDVPAFVTRKAFIADVKKILSPGGLVVLNYFSFFDQDYTSQILLDKLSQIYQSLYRKQILRNVFFYCS